MALDQAQLQKLLRERLCAEVLIHRREDDMLMVETPFAFPDGDHFPIYLTEESGGVIRLSDRGHTMIHVSYEHEVDLFYDGARSSLREQIVREYGLQEEEGVFSIETSAGQLAASLFRFGQALTKIYDLTFLSREKVNSTFYEDLRAVVSGILGEESVDFDYTAPGIPYSSHYPVDCHFEGKEGGSVFLYGVTGRDKARLTTIMLSHFLLHRVRFESVIVFANQQEIPRRDLARLTNVSGTAVASLEAEKDLRRKIERLAA